MISFKKAFNIVCRSAVVLPVEFVPLAKVHKRILAKNIISKENVPALSLSIMDGFACRKKDLHLSLKIIETIPAGQMPQKKITRGTCAQIMTGAVIPEGADIVVMKEVTQKRSQFIHVTATCPQAFIRKKGADLKKGAVLLKKGTRITPVEVGTLALAGYSVVPVYKQPTVGLIITGSEVVEPGKTLRPAQIRNVNGPLITSLLGQINCTVRYYGISTDTPQAIHRALKKAWKDCDVIILSGGVSAGDFDFVPKVLKTAGIKKKFHGVAIKPGKPIFFGTKKGKHIFGLPGNPVSVYVLCHVLIKPFLSQLMGNAEKSATIKAKLATTIQRKDVSRLEYVPIRLNTKGNAQSIDYHGSAHILAYLKAHGIVSLPKGVKKLRVGTSVSVQLIRQ